MNPIFKNTVYNVIDRMMNLGFLLFDITDLNRTRKYNGLWLVELAFIPENSTLHNLSKTYA